MDNALFYCMQKIAPAGSALHYACSSLTESERRNTFAVLTCAAEIQGIASTIVEPAVALAKLHFWQEEIVRAWQNQPSHPAFQVLTQPLASLPILQKEWFSLLQSIQQRIANPEYPIESYWQEAYKPWLWICRQEIPQWSDIEAGLARSVPSYFGRLDSLISSGKQSNSSLQLAQVEETYALGNQCLIDLATDHQFLYRHVSTMVSIGQDRLMRTIQKWQKNGPHIPPISPLRTFWIARRCFNQYLRG